VGHLAFLHGVAQCPRDMLLAQDVGKTLRTVPPVKGLIGLILVERSLFFGHGPSLMGIDHLTR
jgi:hypothetical protein